MSDRMNQEQKGGIIMESESKNIYQRLAAAMNEVAYIQKTATVELNQSRSYKAVTHDEVTAKVRIALLKHGVISFPIRVARKTESLTMVKVYKGERSESVSFYTEIDLDYRFQNIDDREDFVDVPSVGDGIDPQDKSPGKALSMAVKNALLKGLMLETGENEEARPEGDVVNSAFPMGKTGNRATDKWVNNACADLTACTTLEGLKKEWVKVYKKAQEKGCTEDQIEVLTYQKDATKARIEREGEDDIPNFEAPATYQDLPT